METKKKSTGKKILKWTISIILILVITLLSAPFLFKGKIEQLVTNTINKNINATVSFKETNLSFFSNFPLASVTINDIAIINKEPFLGNTLYSAKELSASMNITELFKNANEPIAIKSLATKNGEVNIIFDKNNNANYDVAIKTNSQTTTESNSISLDIEEYQLENMAFHYLDENNRIKLHLQNINHSGKGNFAQDILDLDTKTKANLSVDYNNVNYLSEVAITLDAVLGIDLKNSKYTFQKNTGYINQLPLEFDGFIQLVDETQVYDINFKTPTSDFKNLLALLPKQYSGNLNTIQTSGNFDLNGAVKGTLSDSSIPTFDISFASNNAMFKYSDLPKAVKNINIDAKIINKTGNLNDIYINLEKLNFKIDEDAFAAKGKIANINTNPLIDLMAKGTINLGNINKVYPINLEQDLSGILSADLSTNFDMNSVEKGIYKNIKNTGNVNLSNFKYDGKDVANPIEINKTTVSFNTNTINLKEFDAKTGNSDLAINGSLDNFYGFLFNKEVLKGNFTLNSTNFNVSDFLGDNTKTQNLEDENTKTSTTNTNLKIPAFLDCKFTATAKNVTYDNIKLKNVGGIIYIKDEALNLQNLSTDVFGGKIGFDGNISTKNNNPTFKVDLDLAEINITESFSSLEMLKSIAPIAKTIGGKINSKINVAGVLDENMTPNLKTITGNLFGKLLDPKLNASNSKVLSLLSEKTSFLDVNKLDLDGINAYFSFDNGVVNIKPIPLKYKDVGIEIAGNHTFENEINYDITFNVPVKYLGTEVSGLIAKLNPKDAADIKSIPVKTSITGSFTSPNFSTNLKDATSNLMKDLVEKQKQSLLDKGKDKLKDLLGGNKETKDSTKTTDKDDTKDKIKNTLKNIFGKKKDSTKN